ncbi:DUF2178 domain-containing protein [Virgibacillus dakarensis]|uniref:DUF2178 domain-containing protein n=1 Tax=Lentibacillus populi TaxID=1827502 RepID=A0A9W5TZK2_9BACI|nr:MULTISPECIES: DUF2178 domain-containing protein [Bacillaceae]MTW85520.1 DUF2178 domain-containing protein [Virgibacillus dakarensis]GGB51488.1 hypothetical protein GCM10011409_31300 [Lentibacillus populi]
MFSQSFLDDPYVVLILLGNYVFLIGLFFFQRHIGKKNYRYDERYYKIQSQAKARSWDAMLVIMLIAWPVVIMFDGIGFSFFLLTAIYLLHNITLMITSAYANSKH